MSQHNSILTAYSENDLADLSRRLSDLNPRTIRPGVLSLSAAMRRCFRSIKERGHAVSRRKPLESGDRAALGAEQTPTKAKTSSSLQKLPEMHQSCWTCLISLALRSGARSLKASQLPSGHHAVAGVGSAMHGGQPVWIPMVHVSLALQQKRQGLRHACLLVLLSSQFCFW